MKLFQIFDDLDANCFFSNSFNSLIHFQVPSIANLQIKCLLVNYR